MPTDRENYEHFGIGSPPPQTAYERSRDNRFDDGVFERPLTRVQLRPDPSCTKCQGGGRIPVEGTLSIRCTCWS